MTYDPQDSQALDNGFNFYIFTDDQFRNLANLNNNTAAGELQSGTPKTKRATISDPFRTYTVVVANDSSVPAAYKLMVDNAILVDGSGQSITAQEMSATAVTTGTTTTTETSAAATATTAVAAATTTTDGRRCHHPAHHLHGRGR
ncbi:MAG: hypothetical protein R2873_19075 [Caldilineaceae bacterium]